MIQNRVKHGRRYQEIINTFVKHGFSHMLFRLGLTDKPSQKEDNSGIQEDHRGSSDPHIQETKKTYAARKTKNLMVSDLTSHIWVIKDERSLNQYMDQLRDRIEKELDSNTDIVIRF